MGWGCEGGLVGYRYWSGLGLILAALVPPDTFHNMLVNSILLAEVLKSSDMFDMIEDTSHQQVCCLERQQNMILDVEQISTPPKAFMMK